MSEQSGSRKTEEYKQPKTVSLLLCLVRDETQGYINVSFSLFKGGDGGIIATRMFCNSGKSETCLRT